jgi:hypothetical protein
MSRTLSVAGTLAILIFALWIVQPAKVTTPVYGAGANAAGANATDAPASTAIAPPDVGTTAVDDLAGWPIAAGR